MKNPFQYGKIAENENFIDRDEDRRFLKDALYSGTNVILMSPRRWGKSSLVKRSMLELTNDKPNIKVVHIDAFPVTSVSEFYSVFAKEVLKATSSHAQVVIDAVGKFLKNISPKVSFSPEPMSEFAVSFDMSRNDIDPAEVLNLPEKIAEERGYNIIVCIDEFQKLGKLPQYDKLESQMRSVWQHHQHVSYCLYGGQRHMMSDIFNSPDKPFYRFGQLYNLKKISEADWVKYIKSRFESTGKQISDLIALQITQIAECHSWYVQQLASAVWNFTDVESDNESLTKALQWCIDVNSETFHNICDNMTEGQIGLLKAIAMGEEQLSSSEIIRKYHLGSSASVVKNKRNFIIEDIITASRRDAPRFLDPIFFAWFKQSYL